jgi:hypothetical protein
MKAWLFSLLHVVRTSLSYVVADPPEWLSWLVLTVLLALPIYFVLEILGFGSGPKRRPVARAAAEDALDRIVAATEEIPEAREFTTRLRK